MTEMVEAKVEYSYSKSAVAVYDAWLTPESVREWMQSSLHSMGLPGDVRSVEIDAREGGKFLWSDMRERGEAFHWGTFLELQRPDKIVFTWFTSPEDEAENSSVVTLKLRETETGCTATIIHSMKSAWAEYIPQTEKGWIAMLTGIKSVDTFQQMYKVVDEISQSE